MSSLEAGIVAIMGSAELVFFPVRCGGPGAIEADN